MIRTLVIDDHPDVGGALAGALADDPGILVLGHYARAEEVLRELARLRPDVVVVDHGLPGLNGSQVCERLRRRREDVKVIVLTSYVRDMVALTAFDAGAAAVVVKSSDGARLRRAVRTVASGGTYIDPLLAGRIVDLAVEEHMWGTSPDRRTVEERA